jgi:hypothetical protein
MIGAATRAYGVLFERTQSGRGLPGVENGDAAGGGLHETTGERRDAGHPLHQVQGRSLRRQHRACEPPHFRDHVAWYAARAVGPVHDDAHRGIELAERLRRHVESRDDARGLCQDDAARALFGTDGRLGRDVSPSEILGQRAPYDLAVQRRLQRLERDGFHARASPGAPSSAANVSSADRRSAPSR